VTAIAATDMLLPRLRRGEPDAFESLVRREMPRLLAVARRLLRNEEDAKDAVQDAFINAFRSLASFEGGCQVSTWLHRITVNAALMKLRTRRRKPEDPIEDLLPAFLEDGHHARHPPEWRAGADAILAGKEDREFVRACIDRLPESHRTVLLLRDIEDLDTSEAAAALGISEGAVKVRLHRARQALRTLLEPRFREACGAEGRPRGL
jgi:RNA polymerase sigma-70 factor (ECF subfamily)